MAVPSFVPAKRWPGGKTSHPKVAILALALAPLPLAISSPASPGAASPGHRARVTLRVHDGYSVHVPAGSWVPVTVSVANRGSSALQGEVVLSVPVAPVEDNASCAASGAGFVCGTFANPSAYSPGAPTPRVTYEIPLSLAPGVAKQFSSYALAESTYGNVQALVRSQSGTVVARASAPLPVAYGTPRPAVLVVTAKDAAVAALAGLATPAGPHPQLQYTVPADLPGSAAALGGFSAVTIDGADTSVLSPAQALALEGYVDAGGTLVVAGGLNWRETTAGLPAGLLPATIGAGPVGGTSAPVSMAGLADLVEAPPLRARVDLAALRPRRGSSTTLVEGRAALATQWPRGSGHVVLLAFDPLAPPLASWAGTAALMSRVFAPAFQSTYYNEQPDVAVGPSTAQAGLHNLGAAPINVNSVGASSPTSPNSAVLSPTTASQALMGYLEQMPGSPKPTPTVFGLVMLGYIVVVGPLCFLGLTRVRRRELAWVAVPCLAALGAVLLYETGAGIGRPAMVNEVRVSELAPGSHLAQVVSLGAVYLPRGGSLDVGLSEPLAMVGDLGAGAGATLTVGTGAGLRVGVRGPANSLGGWGASGTAHLAGTVAARLAQSNGSLVGKVTDDLGVGLADTEVVSQAGLEAEALGDLAPGASARVDMAASSSSGVPDAPFLALPLQGASRAREQREEAAQSLYDLGALYSGQDGGAPVFVALARHPLYPPGLTTSARRLGPSDVVVVPLPPGLQGLQGGSAQFGPELVGSVGSVSSAANPLGTGQLALRHGGAFFYQFVLPPAHPWRHLELDVGSLDGSVTDPGVAMALSPASQAGTYAATGSSVVVSAFDYRTGRWDTLRPAIVSGQLLAEVPAPAGFVGPGQPLEVRLSSPAGDLNVYGDVPTLSATAR